MTLNDAHVSTLLEEIRRLIAFFNAEINAALRAGDRECTTVGGALQSLMLAKSSIEAELGAGERATRMADACRNMTESISVTIVGLQYHDRLTQRIDLIRKSLHELQEHLREAHFLNSAALVRNMRQTEKAYASGRERVADENKGGSTIEGFPLGHRSDESVELF